MSNTVQFPPIPVSILGLSDDDILPAASYVYGPILYVKAYLNHYKKQ